MKQALKQIGFLLSAVAIVPFQLWLFIEARCAGTRPAFESVSQAISLIPGTLGVYMRRAFYAKALARCSPTSVISFGVLCSDQRTEIGDHVYLGPHCDIGYAIIGQDALIGSGVHILSGKHQHYMDDITRPIRLQGGEFQCVEIGEGTWIGNGAIIMANVGRHAVVGAGAVVTNDVADYAIVAGNPAILVRMRTEMTVLSS